MSEHEHSLRELAYRLCEEAGRPEGRAEDFWFNALELLISEPRPPEQPDSAEAAPLPASAETAEPPPPPEPAPPARKSSPKR